MKPVLYHWRHMVRDYTRLALDDKWCWCSHCRRPVEHALVSMPDDDPQRKALVCLDCGCPDPGYIPLHGRKGPCENEHDT